MSHTKFPTRFGKYILLDRLNSGGMAEVYRAKVTGVEEFQRLVAIKCMLPNIMADQQFITMFVDEAKMAAQLSHANIVQIYELGKIEDRLYIAMELIQGRDLRHIIKLAKQKGVAIPVGFAAYVVSKAAEGLDAAHRKASVDGTPLNLVHRDVSPQNILVSYDGEVKVVDFGIAKAEERATETRAGVLKGKFAYMAPEQVMGQAIDRRADIFALGAVLYETCTGHKLFAGESDLSILDKVRNATVPDLDKALPADAPPELGEVLHQALARDRDIRFAHASDLAESLAPMLIEDRSIFGTTKAKVFMQALYEDEIVTLGEQLRHFSQVSDADCAESTAQRNQPKESEIFESTFAAAPEEVFAAAAAAAAAAAGEAPSSGPPVVAPAPFEESAETQAFEAIGQSTGSGTTRETGQFFNEGAAKPSQAPIPVVAPLPPTQISDPISHSLPPPTRHHQAVPKGVLYGMFAAVLLMLVVVVVIGVGGAGLFKGTPTPPPGTVPSPTVPMPTTQVPVPTPTTPVPVPVATPTTPVATPTPTPQPTPVTTPTPTPVAGTDGLLPDKRKGKRKERRFGFVSVKANGAKVAKIYLNGRDVGYSPAVFKRVPVGKVKVKVVEEKDGQPARSKTIQETVIPKHTRKAPLVIVVRL